MDQYLPESLENEIELRTSTTYGLFLLACQLIGALIMGIYVYIAYQTNWIFVVLSIPMMICALMFLLRAFETVDVLAYNVAVRQLDEKVQ